MSSVLFPLLRLLPACLLASLPLRSRALGYYFTLNQGKALLIMEAANSFLSPIFSMAIMNVRVYVQEDREKLRLWGV